MGNCCVGGSSPETSISKTSISAPKVTLTDIIGESSHVTASVSDANKSAHSGRGISCQIAIKAPHGTTFQCISNDSDSEKKKWKMGSDINDWIESLYTDIEEEDNARNNVFTSWILYNDEPPPKLDRQRASHAASSSSHGHCKGILAWNDQQITWLIHSVPKYPSVFKAAAAGNIVISNIEKSECEYGQSFIFICGLHPDKLQEIILQLKIMNINVYEEHNSHYFDSTNKAKRQRSKTFPNLNNIIFQEDGKYHSHHTHIQHVAKSKKWNRDIYEYLAQQYGGNWKCETWIRGKGCQDSEYVKNTHQIHWSDHATTSYGGDDDKSSSIHYKSTQDHSKFAVSLDTGQVFIGDLNRMTSQFHRGGGGVIIKDKQIAVLFDGIMM